MKNPFSKTNITDILLITLLAFAPLALASVHVWAYCTIAIAALIIFNLHFLNHIESFKRTITLPVSIGFVALLVIAAFYVVPIPAGIIKTISPKLFDLRETYMLLPGTWQPLSVYSRGTIVYLIKLTFYIMIFLVIVSKINGRRAKDNISPKQEGCGKIVHRSAPYNSFIFLGALTSILAILFHSLCDFNLHIPANALYFTVMLAIVAGLGGNNQQCINSLFLKKLVNTIVIIGFVIAVFGIVQKLSYNGKIYWIISKAGSHFGPYVNYDHFAGFMEMCTFMAIVNFIGKISSSSFVHMRKVKDKIIWFSTKEANKTLIYLFFAVVMTTSLFLSTSRGGILSFCAALSVFYGICIISATKKKRNRLLVASFLTIALIVIMALWIGPEESLHRLKALNSIVKYFINETSILSEIRPLFWKDTWTLIKDFPLTGTGIGTYPYIFQGYRTFAASWGFLRYAHNDYLHFIAEMGIIGAGFIIAFFVWYVRKFREVFRRLRKQG